MRKEKIKTWLPVFPGFYGTLFEPDDSEFDSECEYFGIKNTDALNFNMKSYMTEVSKGITSIIERELSALDIVDSITFEEVRSPREYNFYNDAVDVEIAVYWDNLERFILDNVSEFAQYIKGRYTSGPGFVSSYSNNHEVWLNDLKLKGRMNNVEHKLGSMLEFVCEYGTDLDDEMLYSKTHEVRHISEYCEHDLQSVE